MDIISDFVTKPSIYIYIYIYREREREREREKERERERERKRETERERLSTDEVFIVDRNSESWPKNYRLSIFNHSYVFVYIYIYIDLFTYMYDYTSYLHGDRSVSTIDLLCCK